MTGWIPRLCGVLAGIVLSHSACGQDRSPALEDYNHAIWTAKDGAPVQVRLMAQTPDGWLWLGTDTGVYRFDGVRFSPLAPTNGERLLSTHISELRADPDGDLYIGYIFGGLSVLHADGRLEHLAPATEKSPVRTTFKLVRDVDGSLWVGSSNGLLHLEHGRWSKVGIGQGDSMFNDMPVVALDGHGQLWAATWHHLFRYDRAARRFTPADLPPPGAGAPPYQYVSMAMSPDGRLWNAEEGRFTVVSPAAPGAAQRPGYANHLEGRGPGIFDRAGNLWALRCPTGVCLVAAAGANVEGRIDVSRSATSRLDQPWQLGSLTPTSVLEDREGNIWLASPAGIERFRTKALVPVRIPSGDGPFFVVSDVDGSAWVVDVTKTQGWHYDPVARRFTALPGKYYCATQGPDSGVVLLNDEGIRVRRGGVETHIDLPAGLPPQGLARACARDDGEFVSLAGINSLPKFWDGRGWRPIDATLFRHGRRSHFAVTGSRGQMWVGYDDGGLALVVEGRRPTEYDPAMLGGIGPVMHVSVTPELVVGGETGVSVFHEGRFRRLRARRDEVLRNVTGFVVAADGTRWMNGGAGLLRIDVRDWRRAVDGGAELRYELLDALDGYPGTAQTRTRMNTLNMVGDRLWVSTSGGIVELDPARREHNPVAPQPALLAVAGDGVEYPLARRPLIRAGTTRVRFDFTAPMLRKPERIVFSYRLDGVDDDWQTSTERSATYTGLAPGDYRFRVRAMNEDGLWSERERTLDLHVAPTLVQTVYFKLACVLAGLLLLWFGHRLRLRIVTRTLTERLRGQLEERERIARELHDTVLQTFQSVVLKVKAMLPDPGSESPLRAMLEEGLRDANAAIEEGRDKVKALRATARRGASLPDYLREVGERDAAPGQHFTLRCVGLERPLQPVVEQELCAIGREALRNAFRHANAQRHEAIVEYGARELVLTVCDDGLGIDGAAREKPGHWGLRGIEERARRIHADARLRTAPGAGTTWRIEVKAALAYADGRPRMRWPWRRS